MTNIVRMASTTALDNGYEYQPLTNGTAPTHRQGEKEGAVAQWEPVWDSRGGGLSKVLGQFDTLLNHNRVGYRACGFQD